MKKIILYIVAVLTLVSGCTLGPDFKAPEYKGSDAFRFDSTLTDSVVNLKWWTLFNDPVLDTLVVTALKQNKDVLIAAARIDAAKAKLGYTKAEQWPTVGFSTNAGGGNFGAGMLQNNTSSAFSAYPEMYWEIGFWGKYRRMNESERANLLATEYGKKTVQLGLISTVIQTYFTLLNSRNKLKIAQRTFNTRDSALLIIQERYNFGIIPEIDLNQSQIQREISAAAIPQYKREIALTENTLSILIGETPKAIETGKDLIEQEFPPDIPQGLPADLLKRRPDIQAAEARYAAQNARIGVAEAMRWPSLNLTGLLGYASNDLLNITSGGLAWSVAGSLTGPLFQFGKNKRRVEIEKHNTEVALRQYEQTVLTAFKEVADALIAIETLKEQIKSDKKRVAAAVNAEMLSNERYNKGQTSYLEVLESQRQSFDAKLNYSNTKSKLLATYVALYKALGGGWIMPE